MEKKPESGDDNVGMEGKVKGSRQQGEEKRVKATKAK
jgi:hypothetical protein